MAVSERKTTRQQIASFFKWSLPTALLLFFAIFYPVIKKATVFKFLAATAVANPILALVVGSLLIIGTGIFGVYKRRKAIKRENDFEEQQEKKDDDMISYKSVKDKLDKKVEEQDLLLLSQRMQIAHLEGEILRNKNQPGGVAQSPMKKFGDAFKGAGLIVSEKISELGEHVKKKKVDAGFDDIDSDEIESKEVKDDKAADPLDNSKVKAQGAAEVIGNTFNMWGKGISDVIASLKKGKTTEETKKTFEK